MSWFFFAIKTTKTSEIFMWQSTGENGFPVRCLVVPLACFCSHIFFPFETCYNTVVLKATWQKLLQ